MRHRLLLLVTLALTLTAACGGGELSSDTLPPATVSSTTVTTVTTTATSEPTATTPPTSSPTTTSLVVDVEPPLLVVTDPEPGAIVPTRTYTFRGMTDPGCTVSAVDRWEAEVDEAGNWSIALVLNLGSNVTWFRAVDATGNDTVVETSVNYLPLSMPCKVDADTGLEYCDVFGDIIQVDVGRSEIIFDLYRIVHPGPGGSEFAFVNENPLLRTLRVADDVEIWACPPEPGTESPGVCHPDEYERWTLADLAEFVTDGATFWNVMTLDSIVVDIGQPCPVCG